MFLLECLTLATGCLAVGVTLTAFLNIITCRLALILFKRISRRLPVLPGYSLRANHAHSASVGERVCQRLSECLRDSLGDTFGWPGETNLRASATDLASVKIVTRDERGGQSLDRIQFKKPIQVLEFTNFTDPAEEELRQVRKAAAPALV